jgi:hypothetical protein
MRLLPILVLTLGTLHGQAIIEYGAGAGRGGAAGVAVGKSVVKTIGQLDKTMAVSAGSEEKPKPAQASAVVIPAVAAAPAPTAPTTPLDFSEIVTGMDKADLLKKAGKPGMSVTSMEKSMLVETYWYRSGEDKVTVVLRNGKVATISGAEKLSAK